MEAIRKLECSIEDLAQVAKSYDLFKEGLKELEMLITELETSVEGFAETLAKEKKEEKIRGVNACLDRIQKLLKFAGYRTTCAGALRGIENLPLEMDNVIASVNGVNRSIDAVNNDIEAVNKTVETFNDIQDAKLKDAMKVYHILKDDASELIDSCWDNRKSYEKAKCASSLFNSITYIMYAYLMGNKEQCIKSLDILADKKEDIKQNLEEEGEE